MLGNILLNIYDRRNILLICKQDAISTLVLPISHVSLYQGAMMLPSHKYFMIYKSNKKRTKDSTKVSKNIYLCIYKENISIQKEIKYSFSRFFLIQNYYLLETEKIADWISYNFFVIAQYVSCDTIFAKNSIQKISKICQLHNICHIHQNDTNYLTYQ